MYKYIILHNPESPAPQPCVVVGGARSVRGRGKAFLQRPSRLRYIMSGEAAPGAAEIQPTDYVRVKRKMTTIFLYATLATDTVHDLRARVNHVTKVPTGEIKFFLDKSGELQLDENKSLQDQKVCSRRC